MPNGQPDFPIDFNEDQLVVGLSQLDQVLAILGPIPVTWRSVKKSRALDLALLTLDSVSVPDGYTDPDAYSPLDKLISYLSKEFKDATGQTLIIGKNRTVGPVVGSPYTGGGEGVPKPYTGGVLVGLPYTASGAGPYTGGGLQNIQLMPLSGALPKRTAPPGKAIPVGILDTRLFAHPDLAGRYLASHGTLASECTPKPPDQEAHATFIAGVVLERAPNANLVVDHALNESDIATSSWKVATKMARFADAGVKVLNISFGAATYDDEPPLVLEKAVQVLNRHGVVVVAAAGNQGSNTPKIWPAALHDVVAVGAGTNDGGSFVPAEFSPNVSWVDLIAPGENVYSTYKASGYATWSGTSFAAAAVSGAIAYLIETASMTAKAAVAWLETAPAKRGQAGSGVVIDDIGPR
jgi:hypothetical protein